MKLPYDTEISGSLSADMMMIKSLPLRFCRTLNLHHFFLSSNVICGYILYYFSRHVLSCFSCRLIGLAC